MFQFSRRRFLRCLSVRSAVGVGGAMLVIQLIFGSATAAGIDTPRIIPVSVCVGRGVSLALAGVLAGLYPRGESRNDGGRV